jgi:hypothetical protein
VTAYSPPSHTLLVAMTLLGDGLVVFGVVFTWLSVRATRRPACICDRGEDA